MTKEEIIEGTKLIAQRMGWTYVPYEFQTNLKPGWWSQIPSSTKGLYYGGIIGYEGRTYLDLDFYNSLDKLIKIIQILETEDSAIFCLHNNGCEITNGSLIVSEFSLSEWSNNVFKAIVYYLKNI